MIAYYAFGDVSFIYIIIICVLRQPADSFQSINENLAYGAMLIVIICRNAVMFLLSSFRRLFRSVVHCATLPHVCESLSCTIFLLLVH